MQFGEAVRLARRVRGWSQAEVARAAGISVQFLSDIERGRSTGTTATAAALARVLGLSMDDIFNVSSYVNNSETPPEGAPNAAQEDGREE